MARARASDECVVAIYDSLKRARDAVDALDRANFPHDQVSLVTHSVEEEMPREETLQHGDQAEHNAVKGAGVGGMIGLLLGSPLVAVSGAGLVLIAGPVALGIAGAIVGGFLGAMSGWGVHTDHISQYEKKVADGFLLVIANGKPQEVAAAAEILQQTDPDEIHLHAENADDAVEA